MTKLLETLHLPEDVRNLSIEEQKTLADEVRARIIEVCSVRGGHLASSLGAVELIVALLHVFDPVEDDVLFDVGHQAYPFKILTGRNARFDTLRRSGGVSGFPDMQESPCDKLVAGHAGNALAWGCGYARARELQHTHQHIVSVLGDGVLANGLTLESFNNVAASGKQIIVINDNDFSISPSVGSFWGYLASLRSRSFDGEISVEDSPFAIYGVDYIGCVDGHDLAQLGEALSSACSAPRSVVVHVKTVKGKGYEAGENDPVAYHSFDPSSEDSFSLTAGKALVELAKADPSVVVVTAAMGHGCGMDEFAKAYPDRFFDVGIAEGHALSTACALAARGLKPFVAMYSTFLQRGYDQLVHDIGLSGLPVTVLCDRSGLCGGDGETHHGLLDGVMTLPESLTLFSPSCQEELEGMLHYALTAGKPLVIRYPKGSAHLTGCNADYERWQILREGTDAVLVASGAEMVKTALQVADVASWMEESVAVVNARCGLLDLDLMEQFEGKPIYCLEESLTSGGLGERLAAHIAGVLYRGVDHAKHGDNQELRYKAGVTAGLIRQWMQGVDDEA